MRRGDAGDFGVVVGGGHLDEVGADDGGAGQVAQDAEEFAAGEAAGLGGAGARRMGRVEHVDVDGNVERGVADDVPDPGGHLADSEVGNVHCGQNAEAKLGVV